MWSVISGRTANFKQRVPLLVFFFLQHWCSDLPPVEEKNVLQIALALLSLLEMLLKQREG